MMPTTTAQDQAEQVPPIQLPFTDLTPREREVADLLCLGCKNGEIAERLNISVKTVDTHRGHVLKKLNVRNTVELLRLALQRGWASL